MRGPLSHAGPIDTVEAAYRIDRSRDDRPGSAIAEPGIVR
jgi:hypothetical protein